MAFFQFATKKKKKKLKKKKKRESLNLEVDNTGSQVFLCDGNCYPKNASIIHLLYRH